MKKINLINKIKYNVYMWMSNNLLLLFTIRGFMLLRKILNRKTYSLDIHVADHCNLNCYSCFHYSPIAKKRFIDLNQLEQDLKILSKVGRFFNTINLLGGEPLLNSDINRILYLVRENLPTPKLFIMTNGLLLTNMNNAFWKSVIDNNVIIRISKYPLLHNAQNIKYKEIENFLNVKGYKYEIFSDANEYWSLHKLRQKGRNKLLNFIRCDGGQFCWQLRDGKIIFCATCAYSEMLNERFKTKFILHNTDYISVNEKIAIMKLWKFAFRPKDFCKHCVFPNKKIKWIKSQSDISEWITQS